MGTREWWDPRGWFSRSQSFSSPQNTRFYSMQMALDSGLLTEGATTREAALGVPAVLRARNLICGISTIPLVLLDTKRKPVREPLFEQIDPQVPNVVTLAMTCEDLLMDGIAWWEVTSRTGMGLPKSARHVDSRRVTINPPTGYQNPLPSGFDPASTIYVDGKPRSAYGFLRFDSPNPPLLVAARRAISRAVLLEDTAAMFADNPRPLDYFSPSESGGPLTKEQIEATLRAWKAGRKERATGYVPETLQYNTVQAPTPADLQLQQLQVRAALEIANATGVDPEDLGISTTSRTYQNDVSRTQARINEVLAPYMRAVTDRLNMPDVTRDGYTCVFNLDDYLKADPATRWEIHAKALAMGATDVPEIRRQEDWPERDDLTAPADPAPQPTIPLTGAREGSMQTSFNGAPSSVTLRLDDGGTTFSVDREHRVITGRAVLWDQPAANGEGTFTFRPGSVTWNKAAINRVKLLRDHDWKALLGAATAITETPQGLDVKFKVARGPAGDQALAEAEDGALDGLSIGVDITQWEETAPGEFSVTAAHLNETSLTPRPAFDDARLTSVAASATKGNTMPDKTPDETPALAIDYDALAQAMAKALAPEPAKDEKDEDAEDKATDEAGELVGASLSNTAPAPVNAAARELPAQKFARMQAVKEASPYTFDRAGRFAHGEHDFTTDLIEIQRSGDHKGTRTEAGRRVMEHIKARFDVDRADVSTLNPAVNRPDMYYEAKPSRTPLWDMVNKGGLPNGLSPFVVPKFGTASGLVGDHTEGTEPGSGTFTTTSQTITPTPVSGKASITREVWELGGNPATSNLIWQRMVRSYDQSLEAATATFLATLTAATDIVLTTAATDAALAGDLKAAIIALNFSPADAYEFEAFAVEKVLYTALAEAADSDGRPLFPAIGPSNADGTAANLFQSLNVNGLRAVPAGALASTAGASNSSWLFDPSVVLGWSSAPERLEFAGTDAAGDYAPVAMIDIAIWGYKGFANTDIAGVRQVTYDDAA